MVVSVAAYCLFLVATSSPSRTQGMASPPDTEMGTEVSEIIKLNNSNFDTSLKGTGDWLIQVYSVY